MPRSRSAQADMLVSIYMPTKNRAVMLQSAAASVLRQSYKELELIIVDDGSTDETPRVLADLARLDPRVRVLRNESSLGAPASRNHAIAIARGEWITGIDDDDQFELQRIEALVDYWQLLDRLEQPFSGVYTQDYYVGEGERTVSLKRGSVEWLSMFEYNVVGNQIFTLTDRLREVGGFDPAMPAWQDLDLFIRILKKFGPSRLLDIPLYSTNVEDRPDRISKSKKARLIDAYSRLIAKHPEVTGRERQLLYLQIFGKLYGHRPDLTDVRRFLKDGWNFRPLIRFVRAWLRR